MPTLIGIYGPARSGKDTASDYLAKRLGLMKYAFAEPLKQMLTAGFGDHFYEGDRSGICPETGKSYREMMQTLGTEWGRNMMHPDLWARMAASKWQNIVEIHKELGQNLDQYKGYKGMVISDVRFRSEAEWIRSVGGVVVELYGRESQTPVGIPGHISEQKLQPREVDIGINNNGTVDELYERLNGLFTFMNLTPEQ